MEKVIIVGAGLTGAVIARELAEGGFGCLVIDERPHVAGNCHTERDHQTGIMVHVYGPHIFHTDNSGVWDYVNRFATMMPYRHRVMTCHKKQMYSLPINLLTINQFFRQALNPTDARAYIQQQAQPFTEPANFEEQALSMIGRPLYEAFFEHYTRKQWGLDPTQIPASILKRLPLRFNYNDDYFAHRYQGIPADGYTALVQRILDHPCIEISLGRSFDQAVASEARHVFYTGPLDRYFDYQQGRLPYRTLDFETIYGHGDMQGAAVINYADAEIPYTRITEHKHFAPWECSYEQSIGYVEFSRSCGTSDIPYYPVRMSTDEQLLKQYVQRAEQAQGVTFAGRLGTYAYIDMDVAIARALETASVCLNAFRSETAPPPFIHAPS